MNSIARMIVRRRGLVAAAWLLIASLLLPHAGELGKRLDVSARVRGSESDTVATLLATRFASPYARSAVLVVTGVPSPRTDDGHAAVSALDSAITKVPGVTSTLSYQDVSDSAFVGDNGATFILVGLDASLGRADELVPRLRASTAAAEAAMRVRYPAAAIAWTGEDALNFDLRTASAANVSHAERRAMPLTLALLILAFGAIAAAAIPATVGTLAIGIALGAAALAAHVTPLSIVLQNVVSMLGLGLGIDYTLLLVSRFREALRRGKSAEEAALEATTTAGHSVLVSAAAVAVGFAALLVVSVPDLRSIAVGGLLVVTSSALLAVTLVPALLAWLGQRVDAWRVLPKPRRRESPVWRRWAVYVARHPVGTLALAGLPLVLLAAHAFQLKPRLPRGDWLPRAAESAQGVRALRAMGRGGIVQTIRVVVALPEGEFVLEPGGWAATKRLAAAIERDPRVARVRSLPSAAGGIAPDALLSYFPDAVLRTFMSRDQRLALLEVVPREGVDGEQPPSLARDIRRLDAAALSGLAGVRMFVGGVPALNADYAQAIGRRTPLVVALVLGGTFLALMVGFRSLLVPLKAIALNLLSVGAALGVVVLVFQDGYGIRLLGRDAPLDGTFAAVPLLVFCVVFGLSMDYEVFLLSRVAEARARGASEGAALVAGVARSGRVITSAAGIMVVVFGAFALGDFVLIQILGVALAAAVILDATLVRLAVGPALLVLAGRWNWWPGTPQGLLPSVRESGAFRANPSHPLARSYTAPSYTSDRDRGTETEPSRCGLANSV